MAGVNAEKEPVKLKLDFSMFSNQNVNYYYDDNTKSPYLRKLHVSKNNTVEVEMQPNGGFILTNI